jgi:DNA-binding transcriptional ArsR family regulator
MLKALADETRWRLVSLLLKKPATIGELTEQLDATAYNISKHVRILREAGIVLQTRRGKHVECEIEPALRKQLSGRKKELDLGCCTFKFDKRCLES